MIEALLGPFAADDPATGENVKIAQLLTGLTVAIAGWLVGVILVTRGPVDETKVTIGIVLTFSVHFRATLVPYPPLREADLHRYMLDGAVVAHGISPYRYSPDELSWS